MYQKGDASYTLVSPTLSLLKGVAKLKKLQDEVSYVLVIHLEASIIFVVGYFLVFLAIKPILSSHEATFKNATND